MSNTVIKLRKSSVPSEVPSSLEYGELAINYADGKFYYKNATGQIVSFSGAANASSNVYSFATINANNSLITALSNNSVLTLNPGDNIAITGDIINDVITISANLKPAYDVANAAYNQANTGGADLSAANNWANTVAAYANNYAGFMANSVNSYTTSTYSTLSQFGELFVVANAAFDAANNGGDELANVYNVINAAYTVANAAYGNANSISTSANNYAGFMANSANAYAASLTPDLSPPFNVANAAFDKANSANVLAYNTGIGANAYTNTSTTAANNYAGVMANSANGIADATYIKKTATTQTITGDLQITGNVILSGNATSISTQNLSVEDSLIFLAANNISDIVDIGFVGHYNNGSANVHTGVYRDHASKEYYVFNGLSGEPELINDIVPYANNMVNAVLNADLRTSNLNLGGANAIVWIRSSYDNANAAYDKANNAGGGYYQGNNGDVGSSAGLGDIFRVHSNTLTQNVTIYSGNNAICAGPITVASGKTLTIQTGARVIIA